MNIKTVAMWKNRYYSQAGFSLIEMAIVLLIVAALLGGILGPLGTLTEQADRRTTEAMLEKAREAVIGFAIINGRLPCPDNTNDGIENVTANVCDVLIGNLPWVSLAIEGNDSWNNILTYGAVGVYADATDGTGCGIARTGVSFELCSVNTVANMFSVLDGAAGNAIAQNIPAYIRSGGQTDYSATSAHETENTDGDTTIVSRNFSEDPGNEFDDMLTWISPNVLIQKMVSAGRLP